jgi:hypothetical protein
MLLLPAAVGSSFAAGPIVAFPLVSYVFLPAASSLLYGCMCMHHREDHLGVCVGRMGEGECVGELWDCYGARPSTAIAHGEDGSKVSLLHIDGPSTCP